MEGFTALHALHVVAENEHPPNKVSAHHSRDDTSRHYCPGCYGRSWCASGASPNRCEERPNHRADCSSLDSDWLCGYYLDFFLGVTQIPRIKPKLKRVTTSQRAQSNTVLTRLTSQPVIPTLGPMRSPETARPASEPLPRPAIPCPPQLPHPRSRASSRGRDGVRWSSRW